MAQRGLARSPLSPQGQITPFWRTLEHGVSKPEAKSSVISPILLPLTGGEADHAGQKGSAQGHKGTRAQEHSGPLTPILVLVPFSHVASLTHDPCPPLPQGIWEAPNSRSQCPSRCFGLRRIKTLTQNALSSRSPSVGPRTSQHQHHPGAC